MLSIRTSKTSDWKSFYVLAAEEGWRIPQIERRLFQGPWSKYALACIDNNEFCGLITAVPYQRSGWIGNLLIPRHLRGRGYGSRLFAEGFTQLCKLGVASIWLTASEQGRPIYERVGFVAIDQIERWILPVREKVPVAENNNHVGWDVLLTADSAVWGENRCAYLQQLSMESQSFARGGSTAALQGDSESQVIGPWYGQENVSPSSRQSLLQSLIASATPSQELIIDLIASSPLRSLLLAAGFVPAGKTELMVYGDIGSIKLEEMAALASLGSVG